LLRIRTKRSERGRGLLPHGTECTLNRTPHRRVEADVGRSGPVN
jgi:hypothetical protein